MMRWLLFAMTVVVISGCCLAEPEVYAPPPDKQLNMDEAKELYDSFIHFITRYPDGVPLPLPRVLIEVLERLLLDFPDERFYRIPKGLGLPERVECAYVRSWLIGSYRAEGKVYESLILNIQDILIGWIEDKKRKSGLLYGFPAFPFPDPFQGDPPRIVLHLAEYIKDIKAKGVQISPVIFANCWPLRARWKGDDPEDALVSFNDLAYALGGDKWREIIQRDWKLWHFTISIKGKTLTFAAESQKAVVSGKEIQIRHKVERSFYDLYVPLGDLVRALGGTIRPPKPDELQPFQDHLPISLLVVDLN